MLIVSYQGELGAYSEQAALQFFGTEEVSFHPCTSFEHAFDAVSRGQVDRAVIPMENSLAGTIHSNLDTLLRYPDLTIVGECDYRVRHCLLARPGVSMSDIKTVRSHYMALAQCSSYLQNNGLVSEVAYDTAGSARLIAKEELDNVAAVASKRAAEVYGLNIIEEGIEDHKKNYTRFLVLSREPCKYVPGVPCKSSLVFSLVNGPGILCRALSVFAVTNIDLTRIENRHIHTVREALSGTSEEFKEENITKRWAYVFYVDIARHREEKAVESALRHLQEITTFYRMLGSYPMHESGNADGAEGNTM